MNFATRTSETVYRSVDLSKAEIDVAARTVRMSFVSSYPVDRYGYTEVLDLAGMDLERIGTGRAAFLVEHDRKDHVGVIQSVDKLTGHAVVRFGKSARAEEIFQDVIDGIRTLVSVGYQIIDDVLTSSQDGKPTYTVTHFIPVEISIVSVPADPTVGVGRSMPRGPSEVPDPFSPAARGLVEAVKPDTPVIAEVVEPDAPALPSSSTPAARADVLPVQLRSAPSPERKKKMENETPDSVVAERARTTEILALGAEYGNPEMAREFVANSKSVEDFSRALLAARPKTPAVQPMQTIGMSRKEVADYRILRSIHSQATNGAVEAGLEREASAACEKQFGRTAKGVIVPPDVLMDVRASQQTVGEPAGGGNLVAHNLMSGSMIEAMVNALRIRQLGATVFSDLEGGISFPKRMGLAATSWVGEDGIGNETKLTFGQVPLTPKTVTARTSISRRLQLQSSLPVEMIVRREFQSQVALAIDNAAINGTDANGPQGLVTILTAAQKLVVGTDLTWDEWVALETMVATQNADVGTLAYLTNAKVRGAAKTTEKSLGSGNYIWTNTSPGEGMVNGYSAQVTNAVLGAITAIFANWSDMYVGFWSGMDILAQTRLDNGANEVSIFQDCDVAFARKESFAMTVAAL